MIEEKRSCESTDWIRSALCQPDPHGIMLGWQVAIEHLTKHIDTLKQRIQVLEERAAQRQGKARDE